MTPGSMHPVRIIIARQMHAHVTVIAVNGYIPSPQMSRSDVTKVATKMDGTINRMDETGRTFQSGPAMQWPSQKNVSSPSQT